MTALGDDVLPLIRTRTELYRLGAANAHGRQMHEGVTILQEAFESGAATPDEVFVVTQKAIASALRVIMRADDSSGVIGDAVRRLLDLHPRVAAAARPAPARLVTWMLDIQFYNDCDYFDLDPVAYAPALGEVGMRRYRNEITAIGNELPPPTDDLSQRNWHFESQLGHTARRLAVLDEDVDAIIAAHAGDRQYSQQFLDTAKAFEEIGRIDLALDWAQRATDADPSHQAMNAYRYLRTLLSDQPERLLDVSRRAFDRFPSSQTAAWVHTDSGDAWPELSGEILTALESSPRDAVLFTLNTLDDAPGAWTLARRLELRDADVWLLLADAHEKTDPLAVIPILRDLAVAELDVSDARHYRTAARHLKRCRRLASGTDEAATVDELIAELRTDNRRRPRLQTEFDKAGLP